MSDETYMNRAFELALKGKGTTSPNPLVGAVIVRDDIVLSEGFHRKAGEGHAEYNAIHNYEGDLKGSTLYCTLEPCCHLDKRTPPCTQLIIEKGISKVVISNLDPNPKVSGLGVKQLEEAGIKVVTGVLESFGEKVNRVFFTNMRLKRPYIHLKQALTLDGRIATSQGDSKWISCEEAREEVHKLRYEYDAVMVGSGTAKTDNPSLTCRNKGEVTKVPKRVVVGKKASLPDNLKILSDSYRDSTIIVRNESLDLLLEDLYCQHHITSILLEGGAKLASSFIDASLVDQVSYYIAPKLVGNGPCVYLNDEFGCISESRKLEGSWRCLSSGNIVFEGKFKCSPA